MTFKRTPCPDPIGFVDGKPVSPSQQMVQSWERLFNVANTDQGTVGKALRGVAQAQSAADGAASAANTVQANANATPSGAMTVLTDKALLSASGAAAANLVTDTATISIAGGTPGYVVSATRLTGEDLTATITGSPLASDGAVTIEFSKGPLPLSTITTYRIDATDSAGSPVTESVQISVAITRTDGSFE